MYNDAEDWKAFQERCPPLELSDVFEVESQLICLNCEINQLVAGNIFLDDIRSISTVELDLMNSAICGLCGTDLKN